MRGAAVVIAIDRHTRDGRPIYPMLKSIKISLILASDWSTAIMIVMNIDESGFRLTIYPLQVNYIVMNIDESVFCMPIQYKTGIKTQIMELQFKYPGLWLVNANLNNGITTLISLILRIKTQITELQFIYPVTP